LILTIALVLGTSGPAFAEPSIKVSSSSISFVEGVTDDLIAEASKQFGEKKGDITKATLNLRNVTDDMVAKACAAYPGVRMIELLNSPKLTSVASVAGLADITELTFQDLPKVKDLSPLSKNTKLARMGLTKVGFANADMKWVAPLTDLQGLSVDSARPPSNPWRASKNWSSCGSSASSGLSPLDLLALKSITALKYLVVSDAPVSNPGALSSLAALTNLDIRKTKGTSDLRQLAGLTNLKEVTVSANAFSEADTKILTEKGIKIQAR